MIFTMGHSSYLFILFLFCHPVIQAGRKSLSEILSFYIELFAFLQGVTLQDRDIFLLSWLGLPLGFIMASVGKSLLVRPCIGRAHNAVIVWTYFAQGCDVVCDFIQHLTSANISNVLYCCTVKNYYASGSSVRAAWFYVFFSGVVWLVYT